MIRTTRRQFDNQERVFIVNLHRIVVVVNEGGCCSGTIRMGNRVDEIV